MVNSLGQTQFLEYGTYDIQIRTAIDRFDLNVHKRKLLHFPCVSRIHSTSVRKSPPDFLREGAKCE
ncbi:hypothetical protein GC56T3_3232 [Geobacillus sp. C56-T3]|nr:hypothetical protein GC56T3_3232 [Geobacillus sp. C56-T3]ADU95694.1 hypothetical protein GYMC52_3346 [Geobacillus sp. Y412MC52]